MPLKLRTVEGPLTNAQIDANLVYLEEKIDAEVAAVEQVAQSAEAEAQAARAAAETAQDSAQAAEAGAQAAQTAAESARDDAVAVVYEGDASLDPAPGKIPVARADSYIDAGWIEQLDNLTAKNAETLHRSPNAVTAMFVYDTSKASDGGAFIEKLGGLSLATESLNGKWLGQQANETAARAVSGATTGDYYQQTSDGKIYRLLATSGISQTYRGNKSDWPRLMGMVTESQGLFVYDLTEPGRPLWRHFPVGANEVVFAAPTSIGALNSIIAIGTASGLVLIDFARDVAKKLTTGTDQTYKGVLAVATAGWAT